MEPVTTDLTVSLVEHTNFVVSDRAGDIGPGSYHGFFVSDTRFLSRLELRIGGRRLEPLASSGARHDVQSFYLASPQLPGGLPPASIAVFRDRALRAPRPPRNGREGPPADEAPRGPTRLEERVRLVSYAMTPIEVEVAVEVESDFADIFEVRGRRRLRRKVETRRRRRGLDFSYVGARYRRTTVVTASRDAGGRGGRLTFHARLSHGRPWDLVLRVEPRITSLRGAPPPPRHRQVDPGRVDAWRARAPMLHTDDHRLELAWRRGVDDIASLLLTGPADRFMPAAGVPWYLAVFGRDASITAMQTLLLGPEIANGTLSQLAEYQGRSEDPWREEAPGKIPHEVRVGELAMTGRIPFSRYYGSVDATPLFVMLFIATCTWTGWLPRRGRRHVRELPEPLAGLLPSVEAAMAWIDTNVDADGLLWYAPSAGGGIRNQVWKDSVDSMRYADGAVADPPIAAVEVQGYVVAARRGMAAVLAALGRGAQARIQREAAERLAATIEERFWIPSEGTYAMGLDARGRQVDAVSSNPGHLLWSGAVRRDRAASVSRRLLQPDMFTGWGVRTLSARNPGYNPLGYHIGSVWPHDTSIALGGMARYGQYHAAQRVIDGLLDAAMASEPVGRLPELFAGFDRRATPDLVPYPTACSPQAWASGAIFLAARMLMAMPESRRAPGWRRLELQPRDRAEWTIADFRRAG